MKKLTLRIELCQSDPLIWREIVVPSKFGLDDLHFMIQGVMRWGDSHQHMFQKGKTCYTDSLTLIEMEYQGPNYLDEYDVTIEDLFIRKNSKIMYQYDFDDSWMHEITLVKSEPCENIFTPYCIGGAEDCPPEDCGGIFKYLEMKEILKDPQHKSHKAVKQIYKAMEHFNLKTVNAHLANYPMYDKFGVDGEQLEEEMQILDTEMFMQLMTKKARINPSDKVFTELVKSLPPELKEKIKKVLDEEAQIATQLISIKLDENNTDN